jgi:hypothetical protein
MNYGVDDCLTRSPYTQRTNRNRLVMACLVATGPFLGTEMAVTPAISTAGQEQLARALRDTTQFVRLTHDEAVLVIALAITAINTGNYV